MDKLILIDGNSLLFRAYFAMMKPMVNSKGVHTQGIFAFINMLNKIIAEHSPDHIAVAFDMKEKTFRHERYSEYKAGRNATPIELLAEFPLMHKVLEAMNITILEMPRYEADDIIGTVASKAEMDGFETLIITGDKDALQLVDKHVNVLINKKGMSEFDLYDIPAMKERYNLTPEQFIDLKGLMGDKSDNIPGIPNVGEKKGIALLEQYETIEGIIEHADEIKGKLGENVRENIEQARLSRWLATIEKNVPIDFTWDDLRYIEPDYNALVEIYTELEFNKFLKELGSKSGTDSVVSAVDYSEQLESIKEVSFSEFLDIVDTGSSVVLDILTDDDHLNRPSASSISIYNVEHNVYAFKELTAIDAAVTFEIFAERNYKIIGCDIKRILYTIRSYCENDLFPEYDIQIAEYLIAPNSNKYLLEKMILRYNNCIVGENLSEIEKLFHISRIMISQSEILDSMGLKTLFTECEMPLTLTIAEMEIEGITVDSDILNSIGTELDERISVLEGKIYTTCGKKFNINSPKQLSLVLFEDMGIPYPKSKGKSGYSTSADILEKLRYDYSIVNDILEYRKVAKLKSTYVDGLLNLISVDGKIHPHFQQTITATGRLSCTEPNLQNIPVRDDYGRLIRKAFVVERPDYLFTGSDYSQIELRVLASLSGDDSMISAFKEGKDIHKATASRVFNIPEDKVTSLDRSKAKAVNFGVVYGMSGFGLSENLNISRTEGQKYIDDYFAKHQSVKHYLDDLVNEGEKNREVRTYFGRIRQIPEFSSSKYMEREFAKRLAMNTPIQGTAADIIKYAMNSVSNELKRNGCRSRLILQIHDELIVEGPEYEADKVRNILENCMKNAADLAVELVTDTHTGKTWYELK